MGRFYTWRGPLHDVNPMRRWRGRRYASLYRRIAPGGPSSCAIRMRRGGSGEMTRAMPYSRSVTHENKIQKKGDEVCVRIKMSAADYGD